MSFFDSLRQKAASVKFLDKFTDNFVPAMTRDEKFRLEYKLPEEENILDDMNADVSMINPHKRIKSSSKASGNDTAYVYSCLLYTSRCV